MRTERSLAQRRGSAALAAAGLALTAALGFGLWSWRGAALGALVSAAIVLRGEGRAEARMARRRQLLASPFPPDWRAFLSEHCDHYLRLPEALRARFEDDLRLFLSEKRITGVDVALDDELRLLVACSAVTLSLGWPDYEWQQLAEVLVYPQDFDRDYGFDEAQLAGQAHPWGTVILSAPALRTSFAEPEDGFHVGLHEFAHLLDVQDSVFDGVPTGLAGETRRAWLAVQERELQRLQRGKSLLDPYGAESPVEFLAVAVETFFEPAQAMRSRHRELYELLRGYFGQDPAAWDDARGL